MTMTVAKAKKTKVRPVKLTPEVRLKELQSFIAICFAILEEETGGDLKEISNMSKLSVSTLFRLKSEKFSLDIRFRTVQAIGAAAGLQLTNTEYGYKVIVID